MDLSMTHPIRIRLEAWKQINWSHGPKQVENLYKGEKGCRENGRVKTSPGSMRLVFVVALLPW